MGQDEVAGMGRAELEDAYRELRDKAQRDRERVDILELALRMKDARVTELQARGTELTLQLRESKAETEGMRALGDLNPFWPLAARLVHAREKHPKGPTFVSLIGEVGEVANVALKERAKHPETADTRRRDELLDVAVVAWRLYLGEEDSDGESTPVRA